MVSWENHSRRRRNFAATQRSKIKLLLIMQNNDIDVCIYVSLQDGLFLVRESTNFPGDYTLCVCFNNKVEHYRVIYKDNKLTIDEEEYFENLSQLVDVSLI